MTSSLSSEEPITGRELLAFLSALQPEDLMKPFVMQPRFIRRGEWNRIKRVSVEWNEIVLEG